MLTTVPDDGSGLFQQAIVQRDDDAWGAIVARYRPIMCAWVRRCPSFEVGRDRCEDLADEALARAWFALTPARLRSIENMAMLMAYLRACVRSTVIDSARQRRTYERSCDQLVEAGSAPLEHGVIETISQSELWALVGSLLKNDAERLIVYERFVLNLPPRAIQARYPEQFPDVSMVYSTLRNLCDRLRRQPQLAAYVEQFCAM